MMASMERSAPFTTSEAQRNGDALPLLLVLLPFLVAGSGNHRVRRVDVPMRALLGGSGGGGGVASTVAGDGAACAEDGVGVGASIARRGLGGRSSAESRERRRASWCCGGARCLSDGTHSTSVDPPSP